jgi:hypothetical protein
MLIEIDWTLHGWSDGPVFPTSFGPPTSKERGSHRNLIVTMSIGIVIRKFIEFDQFTIIWGPDQIIDASS